MLTASFPFGTGETFIEHEITALSNKFERVQIIPTHLSLNTKRLLPENVEVLPLQIKKNRNNKVFALFCLFKKSTWAELKIVRKKYRKPFSFILLKTMLMSWRRADNISTFICSNDRINLCESTFYSYWCEDTAIALAQLKKKGRINFAVTRVHGWELEFERHPHGYLPFRHFISANLDALYPISEYGKKYIERMWKIPAFEHVKVAYLGVPGIRTSNINLDRKEKLIVSCSNLIPLKRVGLIIDALSKIQDLTIRWVHFGEGAQSVELQRLAAEVLSSNIRAEWRGRVSNQEVLIFYAKERPDLFVNVSETEGLPVSIMEALSAGIPTIATDVGGVKEIVKEEFGHVLPANLSVEDLIKELKKWLALSYDDMLIAREEARKSWQRKWNAETNFGNWVRVLES